MTGTLSVVATPIGNLEDVTLRALTVLKSVDAIVCETPMVTKKLLAHFDIQKPILVWRQRSSNLGGIAERLQRGEHLAYVTDAGTPTISDPGGSLVARIVAELPGVTIHPIPGPSALTAALSIAGVPADRCTFFGFPPLKKGRNRFFEVIAELEHTAIFFEGPHRILKSLEQLRLALGTQERTVIVCRELTKMYESVYRGAIAEVQEKVAADPVKGEYTIVVGPVRN